MSDTHWPLQGGRQLAADEVRTRCVQLSEFGWKNDRIARALGITEAQVAEIVEPLLTSEIPAVCVRLAELGWKPDHIAQALDLTPAEVAQITRDHDRS
jgi:plasmid maintenance system antidote protein VapI